MKRLLLLLVTAVLAIPTGVETASGSASRITEASVRSHMEFLAGDALNGRASGSRDEWIAAAYVASQLRRWGVEPLGDDGGYVQDVRIERSETSSPPMLSIDGRRFTHGKDIVISRLGGARLSGALQKYSAGVTVSKGSALLLPEGGAQPPAADTAAAAMILVAESEQARTRRLAAPPRPLRST